jgi:molecular chaperone GrpE (heat shock protein)
VTPFQEALYRLLQEVKQEATAFTSASEDAGNETHKIIKFAQNWDFKTQHDELAEENKKLKVKILQERQLLLSKVTKALVKELVPIMDELFTLAHITQDGTPVDRGLKISLNNFEKFLERHDGGLIKPKLGDPIDPTKHQVIKAEQDPTHYGNTVAEVYRYGYTILGQVIREAEVKVKCGISKGA